MLKEAKVTEVRGFNHRRERETLFNFNTLGLDGVCGSRDGLKGSKGEPGYPGDAGMLSDKKKIKAGSCSLVRSIQVPLVNVVVQEKRVTEVNQRLLPNLFI